jgi:aspartate racemase
MSKIIGILGGMGPLSTIELMNKIVELTPVKSEHDHLRILVDNRPEIPDRTAFILGKGPSPVPFLEESAKILESCGCQILGMACNTAHAFIEDIQKVIDIPIFNMLELLAEFVEANFQVHAKLALLATTGGIKMNLFQEYLTKFQLIVPDEKIQNDIIMEAIYGQKGIKTLGNLEYNREKILMAIESLKINKPVAVIAGCTEISLAIKEVVLDIPVIDPMVLLAKGLVNAALSP